jgi:LemA protein
MLWIIALAIVALIAAAAITARRGLIRLSDERQQAWATLETQLVKREELMARIIELCVRLLHEEHEAVERVTQAVGAVQAAARREDIPALAAAEKSHQAAVETLFALTGNYPQLAGSKAFEALRDRVATLDGRVAERREQYNLAASMLNMRCSAFPHRLVAWSTGVHPAALLDFGDSAPGHAVSR